jgi:hypothetical protein
MARGSDSAVATKVSAGAPEAKIEITPEMIEAGLIWLHSYNREADIPEEIVKNIFMEMSYLELKKGLR